MHLTVCYLGKVGVTTTIFTARDAAGNRASFNLTTVVLDTLAPTIAYQSNYETASSSPTLVVERVEASLTAGYSLGQFTVTEQPSKQMINLSTKPSHAVKRGKALCLSAGRC